MIKEKEKQTKYNLVKTKKEVAIEYLRTIFCSFLLGAIITCGLAMKSRSDMIKNLYADNNEKQKLEKRAAQDIISQSDLTKGLINRNYSICLKVGDLYNAAGDYKKAQYAYELALSKTKPNNYKVYYKLICTLCAQDKLEEAEKTLNDLHDYTNKDLVKFKTRANIVIGDKYYSISKFISASKCYENANFYYSKLSYKDKEIDNSIKTRIVNAYIHSADLLVDAGKNSDAIRFLQKAEKIKPKDFNIKYKLAIILSDADPEKAVKYLEPLLETRPQDIDYSLYNTTLVKAAKIADLDSRPTQAKYYRYKIHSIDMYLDRKVVYKNDIVTGLESFIIKKVMFTYPLIATYKFANTSTVDIHNLKADFVLCHRGKPIETVTETVATKAKPLVMNGYNNATVSIKFKKKIFTKKELKNYTIKIYVYKDNRYKTLVSENKIPQKSIKVVYQQ